MGAQLVSAGEEKLAEQRAASQHPSPGLSKTAALGEVREDAVRQTRWRARDAAISADTDRQIDQACLSTAGSRKARRA